MEIRGPEMNAGDRLLDHGLKTDASGNRDSCSLRDVVDAAIAECAHRRSRCIDQRRGPVHGDRRQQRALRAWLERAEGPGPP